MKKIESLTELAKIFNAKGATLYAVGGYVRDQLSGLPKTDIDLTSKLKPNEVIELLSSTKFKTTVTNAKLGTVLIDAGDIFFEHTTFRSESYGIGGSRGAHSPDKVVFIEDVKQDSNRRDFTVNAMYQNLLTDEILDFHNGREHLKHCLLVSVLPGGRSFLDDGLRIMRLVRLSGQMGFRAERRSFLAAKNHACYLADITPERIGGELVKILDLGPAAVTSFEMLNKIGAAKVIFGNDIKLEYFKKAGAFPYAEMYPLVSLTYDNCGFNQAKARKFLKHFYLPKAKVDSVVAALQKTSEIINAMPNLHQSMKNIEENKDAVFGLLAVIDKYYFRMVIKIYNDCIVHALPLTLSALKIKGDDITALGIKGAKISETLNHAWNLVLIGNLVNDKVAIIEYLKRSIK